MSANLTTSASSAAIALRSSQVVTPTGVRPATVLIEGQRIVGVVDYDRTPADANVVDVGDLVVSPGVVDSHVHINEPGRTEWEGFETATKAAAAGGITTLIDMPLNSSPVTTTRDNLLAKRNAAAGKCYVDVGFHGGLIPENANHLQPLIEEEVCGIKAFLCDSGLEEFPAATLDDLEAAVVCLKEKNAVLLAHAEICSMNTPAVTDARAYKQYLASRPAEFEIEAIELLMKFCRQHRTPVHIVHLTTAKALPIIADAKAEGLPLTVETCPHYLYFASEEIPDGATKFKCAPPIRDASNRAALRAAVASGLIDTIGSDHSPCPPELKLMEQGDFTKAWGGIASLQLSLAICNTIAQQAGWSFSMLATRMSETPAKLFQLGHAKGRIEVGLDADLVVWDPNEQFSVVGAELYHRHAVTPYDGCKLSGVVKKTFMRGEIVFDENQIVGQPTGMTLKRKLDNTFGIAEYLNRCGKAKPIDGRSLNIELEKCCASKNWIAKMVDGGSFASELDVMLRAERIWRELSEPDYLEAFAAHPQIGDVETLRAKYSNTRQIAADEQSNVDQADEGTLHRLAKANQLYLEKFGFIFIIFATGKTTAEMLAALETRLKNNREQELANAAIEQLKITQLRLRKLIT